MPNLQQIIELKETYGRLKKTDTRVKEYLLKKSLDTIAINKAFSFNERTILEHFNIPPGKPDVIEYFENVKEEDVVLLFIDIADFSEITASESNKFIASYLKNYYTRAIPIIYKHGGQIEKLMGDGIICVFGKPFIDVSWPEEFNKAELCSKEIIDDFRGTNKAVKIALHSGSIKYFKTPVEHYEEYTMIGKPITELFRLESVAKKNAINFFKDSIYDGMNPRTKLGMSAFASDDVKLFGFDVDLKGTDYSRVRYMKV